ncbi:CRISPR-associated protein Cas4 [Enterococcus sp. BWT-B8]|uniref:CRISPR-associated protein Cas4 n=1 Tax=Enterococcus sp. BWT-B8 TaxID=2885157 RepID=UPI001E61EC4D|nr:CRISPR-associated protein Cas4 [Enterococcus sp. BWT-B8]MCB5951158.1 CRISPR-associated protein Cas4 [Enterococcus sp. BWT-B8]
MKITGTMFSYYYICQRKLWLFANHIQFESENENVQLGKILDQTSYSREEKHILIDETIQVDFIQNWQILHEVKKSTAMEEAAEWQVKYYLYYLEQKGVEIEKGVLDYPKLKIRKDVFLTEEDRKEIPEILCSIHEIAESSIPAPLSGNRICKKCAYYEYCFI